jgi:uncharacterized protein YcgI (DUF1989 family)
MTHEIADISIPPTPVPETYLLRQELLIPPGKAKVVRLSRGDVLQLIDVKGHQVSDLMAWRLDDPEEVLSPTHTISCLGRLVPTEGEEVFSNRRHPLLRIQRDTVGRHDLLVGCCDPYRYDLQLGAPGHPSCLESIRDALAAAGESWTPRSELAWNVFMNNVVERDGSVVTQEPPHRSGDYIELKALEDLGVVATSCPQDLTPCNAWVITEMAFRVYEPDR